MQTDKNKLKEENKRDCEKKKVESCYPYAELSVFDDFCSSLLLDTMFLGFETHKFMPNSIETLEMRALNISPKAQVLEKVKEFNEDSLDKTPHNTDLQLKTAQSDNLLQKNKNQEHILFVHEEILDAGDVLPTESKDGIEANGETFVVGNDTAAHVMDKDESIMDVDKSAACSLNESKEKADIMNLTETIFHELTSSDALAVILAYFIRNNILPKKEVEDSATQLIQFLQDPSSLRMYFINPKEKVEK